MSCQIKLTALISDVPAVRRCLFPTDDLRGSDSWLQLCEISASPTGDIIAIASEKRLVTLSVRWNSNNSLSHYDILFSGCVDNEDPIRAILCLPVVLQNHSSQVGPEWTCIAIGFESGYVRFYTEDCKLLFNEQFHNECVCSLKCQSQHSPKPNLFVELKPEELYIQYLTNVCVISGIQLFTLLRNHREQLLKGLPQNDGNTILSGAGFKKWGFSDQFAVNDIAMVGLDLANTFDHLLTASTCGGFDTKYRAMAPHNNLVIAAGSKPFVGFHYALEGGTQPVLTDVAKAVASKLKSALPGWLTGNKASTEKQLTLALQPAESMGCRFGVCDLRRTAISIILSQDRRLALVNDVLGRIILIDSHRGVVLRMFKGYRDAQCAFIHVPDEKRSKHRSHLKIATFVLIYAPKKGTFEIFSAQQGLKIATFTASKFSTLLYINYGLVGFTVTSKSKYLCNFTCALIDPDGQIKEIVIPFHFALTEENSMRARDIHLYKRLKQFIKSSDQLTKEFVTEAVNTCSEIKTGEIQLQCLQMLMSCRDISPDVILKCTEYFLDKYQLNEQEEINSDIKTLKCLSLNLNVLTNFYIFLQSNNFLGLDVENGNNFDDQICNKQPDTKLCLGDKVIGNLQKLLDLSTLNANKKSPELKVSFSDNSRFSFGDFLSIFDVFCYDKIKLKSNIEPAALLKISEFIFDQFVVGNNSNFDEFQNQILKINVITNDLFKMILYYWVDRPLNINLNLEKEMNNLSQLIYILSKTEHISKVTAEYNEISPFWTEIRETLENSARPFPALTAALICRNVAQKIEYDKELQQSGTSLEEENMEIWEKMSQENCEWMLLIGKLEDISLLNIILSNKPYVLNPEHCTLPKLKHSPIDISLKYVLEKGKGAISELVAQWLTTAGVEPKCIIQNCSLIDDSTQNCSSSDGANTVESNVDQKNLNLKMEEPLFEHLHIIKKQFPYSLEPSVLLANMCWEYAIAWQKELQEFSYLESTIKCLSCIPQFHIKQGLCNLVWNTHLKIIFESACKLINKVGKLPKEKLCKQDTGLTDHQIISFISICTDFLDSFLEVVQQSYNSEKFTISYESIWENDGQPLAELALQQSYINYELLHVHYQLSLTIQMITRFTVKHNKPVNNLYDSAVISLFFTDFQQKTQASWNKCDTKMHTSRTQFLLKVISASIETVTINDNQIYSMEHVKWMSKCLYLARVWNLDIDLLKRFQVTQLFSNGFDSIAEELLSSLTELDKLGPDLLGIAGKRLHQLISSSSDLSEKITALSPALSKYLDSLDGEWCSPSSLDATMHLGTHCIRCLDENQMEYKIACQLLEACSTLQDLQR